MEARRREATRRVVGGEEEQAAGAEGNEDDAGLACEEPGKSPRDANDISAWNKARPPEVTTSGLNNAES